MRLVKFPDEMYNRVDKVNYCIAQIPKVIGFTGFRCDHDSTRVVQEWNGLSDRTKDLHAKIHPDEGLCTDWLCVIFWMRDVVYSGGADVLRLVGTNAKWFDTILRMYLEPQYLVAAAETLMAHAHLQKRHRLQAVMERILEAFPTVPNAADLVSQLLDLWKAARDQEAASARAQLHNFNIGPFFPVAALTKLRSSPELLCTLLMISTCWLIVIPVCSCRVRFGCRLFSAICRRGRAVCVARNNLHFTFHSTSRCHALPTPR
jgi:hypothetical protein